VWVDRFKGSVTQALIPASFQAIIHYREPALGECVFAKESRVEVSHGFLKATPDGKNTVVPVRFNRNSAGLSYYGKQSFACISKLSRYLDCRDFVMTTSTRCVQLKIQALVPRMPL